MGHGRPLALITLLCVTLPTAVLGAPCAGVCNVADGNSQIAVDPESQNGFDTWIVDGVSHLFQEWFWLSITGAGQNSLDSFTLNSSDQTGDTITLNYAGRDLSIDAIYQVSGGANGSGTATVTETLRINNTNFSTAVDVGLFAYTDLDINDASEGQDAASLGPGQIEQTAGLTSVVVTSSVGPDSFDLVEFSTLRGDLNADNLAILGNTALLEDGDVTFAFFYDLSLGIDESIMLQWTKALSGGDVLVPIPAGMWLFGSGVGAIALARRRVRSRLG